MTDGPAPESSPGTESATEATGPSHERRLRQKSWVLRVAVYAMLVLSAGATFLFSDRLWTAAELGDLPIWAPLVAPSSFTLFVVVYTVDRWFLVQRRNSSLGRAFFQVGLAILFLTLLWPEQASRFRQTKQSSVDGDPVIGLLQHPQADVRAAVCELLGLRASVNTTSDIQKLASNDASPRVRNVCTQALMRLRAARDEQPPR